MDKFRDIDTWVFDLDNTLYPPTTTLFDQVHDKMNEFIVKLLGVTDEEAHELRRSYFHEHGTTLRGLMSNHNITPDDFLAHVHDLDLSVIPQSTSLNTLLQALPGRKVIYTNASTDHAVRVTEHLGIQHHFDGIFDIIAAEYRPKPDPAPYNVFVDTHKIDPRRACMVEDIAHNLKPAHDMGMRTVWLKTEDRFAMPPDEGSDYVHHIADDVEHLLTDLTAFFASEPSTK